MKGASAAPEPVWAPRIWGLREVKGEDRCVALALLVEEDLEDWTRPERDRSVAGPTTYSGKGMSESCSGRSGLE